MTESQFLTTFAEALGIGYELSLEDKLLDLKEWDSLGFVIFLAMADTQFKKKLSVDIVKNVQIVKDLYILLKE